jgi:hypothetical protein
MLQVLIFAPYVVLASSFVLAATVAIICCSQSAHDSSRQGVFVVHPVKILDNARTNHRLKNAAVRSARKSALASAA